jgi:hypothetical protein
MLVASKVYAARCVQKDYALVASTVYASCKQNLEQVKSVTVSKPMQVSKACASCK